MVDGGPTIPITVLMGVVDNRIASVAQIPTFNKLLGIDLDQHISQFHMASIANNGRNEDVWLK